jgi:hypothetical protein
MSRVAKVRRRNGAGRGADGVALESLVALHKARFEETAADRKPGSQGLMIPYRETTHR